MAAEVPHGLEDKGGSRQSLYRYLHYGVDNLGVKEMDAMATVKDRLKKQLGDENKSKELRGVTLRKKLLETRRASY